MKLSNSEFKLGTTVVLAYPDDTRLGGYRAALELWTLLAGSDARNSSTCTASFDAQAAEVVQPQDVSPISVAFNRNDAETSKQVPIVLATPASHPELSLCLVSGLPAPERIPELVDSLISLLEEHDVKRVVVPAAANITGVKDSDRLWAEFPASANKHIQSRLTTLACIPSTAQTSDVFLSTLSNIAAVSGIGEAVLLMHADKRPGGSAYRQSAVFGEDYADSGDADIVSALVQALAMAVGIDSGVSAVPVKAVRERLDVDAASKDLQVFG
ncbi:hypothetical protein GGH12_001520 [Coemansia sp. RSA 1822]|nr:hypothetical protein LPJ76_002746 [Coemansia sp. RSA 638]KAJ2123817.1 hypothetical protein IW147_002246 [Coemansia sp. RSA 720]KAJ2543513.1 hypothetical protein GGF49_002012 [Coemansia sp. RSA 1853]KAJ2565352.1 hypothetical protein GGH12_001520 [Coemansia sp. RSA 1822]